jgi:hypothetical protein
LKRGLFFAAALCVAAAPAQAGALSQRFCGAGTELSAAQQDVKLRVADIVKRELEASGRRMALVARSGLNLGRLGLRYSHAGISLKANEQGAWAVRQLYYACEEGLPRLFDQGIAGFVSGTDDPNAGYLSIVLLPAEAEASIEAAALNRALATGLVAGRYSANAYAFGTRYQNCNQWLVELLAAAWSTPSVQNREQAQQWLKQQGYQATPVVLPNALWLIAAALVPWVHQDDHPEADLAQLRMHTSLPDSIEAFVRERWPDAQRIELCHNSERVVLRRGWTPIADACLAEAGDRSVWLFQ